MLSFLCPHCRGILRTNEYREFVRRRAESVKEVSLHVDTHGRLILKEEPAEDWERQVSSLFDSCPLCNGKILDIDVKFGRRYDYVSCVAFEAKWQIDWKGKNYEIDSATLVQDSIDKKGESILWKVLKPEFWKRLASSTDKRVPLDEIGNEEETRFKTV